MRNTFVRVLDKIAEKDERVICVIGDTGFSVFEEFEKKYKDRFVNIGIAEQNFVSFGAGLAAMGMKPFIYNVVSFMTYRAFEQIELDVSFQENPVVLVGVGGACVRSCRTYSSRIFRFVAYDVFAEYDCYMPRRSD